VAATTLNDLFRERVLLTPEREAYRQFDAKSQQWISYSWAQIHQRVLRWRTALKQEDLPTGARIAILVPNSIEHVCMDQAALSLGFVPVPLHVVDNPENLAFVIGDCGASLLLVDSAERWAALEKLIERMPALGRVVYLNGPDGKFTRSVDSWLICSDRDSDQIENGTVVESDSLAAIVYTSGTTGRPKGVMLSHRNVVSNVNAIKAVMPLQDGDLYLSFLPLSHTLERTVGYYQPMAAGATVAFARSIPLLMDDMRVVRPTMMVSVPRIYERVFTGVQEKVGTSAMRRRLFALLTDLGWRRFEHTQSRGPNLSLASRALLVMLDWLIARPVRARASGGCASRAARSAPARSRPPAAGLRRTARAGRRSRAARAWGRRWRADRR